VDLSVSVTSIQDNVSAKFPASTALTSVGIPSRNRRNQSEINLGLLLTVLLADSAKLFPNSNQVAHIVFFVVGLFSWTHVHETQPFHRSRGYKSY
jgi:hypothetical protein